MSEQEKQQEPKQEASNLDELEAKISALEEKKQSSKLDETSRRIKEMEKRLQALQESEKIENVKNTFNNAISSEQQWEDLTKKVGTREERIKALEKDTMEKLNDLRILLSNDQYQQYFFSSLNTDPEDEKLRRFCFHINRMSNEEFLEKFKSFSLQNKFSLK